MSDFLCGVSSSSLVDIFRGNSDLTTVCSNLETWMHVLAICSLFNFQAILNENLSRSSRMYGKSLDNNFLGQDLSAVSSRLIHHAKRP